MEYTSKETDLIVADSFAELTNKQKRMFLHSVGVCCENGTKYSAELIKTLGDGVYNKMRADFFSADYRAKVTARLDKKGLICVTRFSEVYPESLANIPLPPLVLYCKGNTALLSSRCFGIVGSRRTQTASLAACRKISEELTARLTVVTGVADGADSAAAEGAVKSGALICVLPYGYDYVKRSSNYRLLKKAEERGLLVTEFPPQISPQRFLYLVRNRIIAGLCEGVLVVSAAKRSGALNTAGYAADYGREVFAFPYSLGVASGEGCNGLIKNGAYLCENVLDIFSCFGLEYNSEKQQELTPEEETVLGCIKELGEAHVQIIANSSGLKPFMVTAVCSSLEIKGLIVKAGGNKYAPVK